MFNGRFHPYSSILSVLSKRNIDCVLHERGTLPTNWRLAKNTLPYDLLSLMKWIDQNMDSIDFTCADLQKNNPSKIGEFMEKRFKSGQQNYLDYNGTAQLDPSIYQLIHSDKPKVTYYTSSLDEICIFDSEFTYTRQLQYLEELAAACNEQHFTLIVRQHPNLGQIGCPSEASYFLEKVRILQNSYKFTIIEPDITCHWSMLASKSALNVVPYSSLYLDMLYHSFPCISLGPSAHLGKLTSIAKEWKQSIESIEQTSIFVENILNDSSQKRRIKFFAYAFYLACCIEIPMAGIADNYLPRSWGFLGGTSDEEIMHCQKLISWLFCMDDFPMVLHGKALQA